MKYFLVLKLPNMRLTILRNIKKGSYYSTFDKFICYEMPINGGEIDK